MDFFQGVVADYLRADRSCFISPEFYLPNDLCQNEPDRKKHWFVDVLALQMEECCAYLCEVTYAKPATALLKRLRLWHKHWQSVREALHRDAHVPSTWTTRPWLFLPQDHIGHVLEAIPAFDLPPKITPLEMTLPWRYCWDRRGELAKPNVIPVNMQ